MSTAPERQRRRRPEEEPTTAAQAPPATARPDLLALQRSAGNRRVANWLLQRDKKVADDADELGELPVKDLVVDKDTVSIGGRAWYFKNDRLPARPGIGVDVRFGGPMAKDKAKEDAVRNGLGSMALMMFGLDGTPPKKKGDVEYETGSSQPSKPRPPTTDIVRVVELDLTAHGGQEGTYRFAAVAAKGAADAPKEVVILVELIGARRKAFADKLDATRKAALEKRFSQFGFVKKAPAGSNDPFAPADDTMPWLDESWGKVLQALEMIPDDVLSGVPGIAFERGRGAKGPGGEAGQYTTKSGLLKGDKPERVLRLYDETFKNDDSVILTVAHEIGHAVSEKPAEPKGGAAISAGADYQKAAKADGGKAITKYGAKNWEEHYAEAYSMFIGEPATMKVMRPKLYEYFESRKKP